MIALHLVGHVQRGQAGTEQHAAGGFQEFYLRRPQFHHRGLQLRRHGVIDIFLREQRDEAGLRALRRANRQHRRAMKSETARDNRQMPKLALVPGNGAARGEIFKIVRQRPVPFARVRTRNQANVFGDFQPPDERPGGLSQHPGFGRTDGQGDGGFNRRAEMFAGVGVQAGWHVHGEDRDF